MAPPSSGADGDLITKHAEIVRKDEDRRIVTAPVLVPDKPDRHGDVVSKDNIQEVAYTFLPDYANIDVMHTLQNVGVPVESYLAPQDLEFEGKEVPEGSWMLSVKVTNPEVWQAVKKGILTGFSIYGFGHRPEDEEGQASA